MSNNPTCFVCDEAIRPGERREATTTATGKSGTKHWACGSVEEGPGGILGNLEPEDLFEIKFPDGDWHHASVEGYSICGREFVLRAIIRDHQYAERGISNPLNYTDQFDIVTTPHGNSWTVPVAFEVEPDWPAMEEGPGRSFEYEHHKIGEVKIRPTDLPDSQYDWEFWADRPTDPLDLYKQYVEHGKTTTEIADELGVSDWTVRKWMDRVGIDRRNFVPENNSEVEG